MADITVYASGSTLVHSRQGLRGPYWISETVGAMILLDSGGDLRSARTTDGGDNWTVSSAFNNVDTRQVACFFDKEVPGDTGNKIHITLLNFTGAATGHCYYWDYDINTDTLGTVRTVAGSLTVNTTSTNNRLAICKSRNGNLYVGFVDGTEEGFYRSTDGGVTRGSRTVLTEGATAYDYIMFFPANTGDDADIGSLFRDVSANVMSIKMYDDSANTRTETAISSGVDNATYRNFDAAVRHSDGHIILCIYNNYDTALADIDCYDINPSTISSVSISTKTDVMVNAAEAVQVAVMINQQDDYIYVGTLKNGTRETSADAVFYVSTNGGTSRGSEQVYSDTTRDYRYISGGRTVGDAGGFIQFSMYDIDLFDIFVNTVNDIAISGLSTTNIGSFIGAGYVNIGSALGVSKANIGSIIGVS